MMLRSLSARRWLAAPMRSVDRAMASRAPVTRILVEFRTPMHRAVLRPVIEAVAACRHLDVRFTSDDPDMIRPFVPADRYLTHSQCRWRRFDLYLNADPWAAASLKRCSARVNFFHGVAGKYDLDKPVGLPMGLNAYDRVAFINADRMQRYLDARIVTPAQAVLVGYPKLDALAQGRVDGRGALARLAFAARQPTALYAPTFSPASSLQHDGESIVLALARAGFNVVVKLHDRSLDPNPRYNGGVDWRARFATIARTAPVRLAEDSDSSPWLAAADLLVTDHSSVGFEYLVLDRPLIVYDVPALIDAARINPEKVRQLRSAATVVRTPNEVAEAAAREMVAPAPLSPVRRRVAEELFYDAGRATERAVALIEALLPRSQRAASAPVRVAVPARPEAG